MWIGLFGVIIDGRDDHFPLSRLTMITIQFLTMIPGMKAILFYASVM